jgi:hypothetical protein
MRMRYHGETARLRTAPRRTDAFLLKSNFSAVAVALEPAGRPFDYMFPALADDPDAKLPVGPETVAALRALGEAMGADEAGADGVIPAVYTYFGQFIDHDITKTSLDPSIGQMGGLDIIEVPNFAPLTRQQVNGLISNVRSAPLDLDSVYEGLALEATSPDGRMRLSAVSDSPFGAILTADRDHDLPRRPRIKNPSSLDEQMLDREALIGDPRNDENLIVNQLHVAFLRAHNVLINRFGDAVAARAGIRRRYQWAVLHDFLKRVGDPATVADILGNGPSVFKPTDLTQLFMPLEFAGAAYRFGHSMVRQEYEYNSTFNSSDSAAAPATFNFMFTFTALSGNLAPAPGQAGSETLPDNWIIEWPRFFEDAPGQPGENPARAIDSKLAFELGRLPDFMGVPIPTVLGQLASRNLLRGYLLGLPTGQAVAAELGVAALAADVIAANVPDAALDAFTAAGLADRTPLWFYVLVEAGQGGGEHLGPVGTRIVGETLWNMAAMATDSVISQPPSEEELASGEFTLRGIVKLGQDPGMQPL